MRRFLINNKDVNERKIWLCGEESHHLTAVLKCAEGEEIELFDGSGTLLTGVIEQTGKKVLVRIVSRVQPSNQKQRSLYLYQADLKGKNMDFIIQKAVELGVERVFPFTCSRSQGRVNQERRRKKLERWQKIIQAACKQSGRLTLMKCAEEAELTSLLGSDEQDSSDLRLLFWETEHRANLSEIEWKASIERVCIMLGPEGGFSEQEVEKARAAGWQTVSLGSQILRAETAAIAAIAIVQHRLGSI